MAYSGTLYRNQAGWIMSEDLTLVAIGPAALFVCYRLATWVKRQRTLRAAERIAHSQATERKAWRASPKLQQSLDRYRVANVRANLGASSELYAAAELVREHRLSMLERR
jgi:hypothetical protein